MTSNMSLVFSSSSSCWCSNQAGRRSGDINFLGCGLSSLFSTSSSLDPLLLLDEGAMSISQNFSTNLRCIFLDVDVLNIFRALTAPSSSLSALGSHALTAIATPLIIFFVFPIYFDYPRLSSISLVSLIFPKWPIARCLIEIEGVPEKKGNPEARGPCSSNPLNFLLNFL